MYFILAIVSCDQGNPADDASPPASGPEKGALGTTTSQEASGWTLAFTGGDPSGSPGALWKATVGDYVCFSVGNTSNNLSCVRR